MKTFISTIPFGAIDPYPINALKDAGLDFRINSFGRRLHPDEVASAIGDSEIVIAGTEPITADVMAQCPNLKAICRVGIGLDSVDLTAARRQGIAVSYTPDGPSPAVAELAVGLILDLLRGATRTDRDMRQGIWSRFAGKRIACSTIGILGVGRIGSRVIRHLSAGFPGVRILANDVQPDPALDGLVEWTDKPTLFRESDVISLHLPLTPTTRNLISAETFEAVKESAVLINTARGGIVNEDDLADALTAGKLRAAAVDVFEHEPYNGPLTKVENVVLTCHMGSMTEDCRARMEIEATDEAIRFARGEAFRSPVPEEEYRLALMSMEAK